MTANPLVYGKPVWAEDDALPCDRERLEEAYRRITGNDWAHDRENEAWFRYDTGDAVYYELYNGYAVCVSYPGNSAIYHYGYCKTCEKKAPLFTDQHLCEDCKP